MAYTQGTPQDRIIGATGAAALVGLIGYGLVAGLGVDFPRRVAEDLKIVALLPDAPPPKPDLVPARRPAEKRKEGAASLPNLRSKPTEIVAPPPPIMLRQPPPVVVAPVAGPGFQASAGAAPVVGPGTGSGGQGNGLGSGDGGDGDGGGGGTDAEQISRGLQYKNLPLELKVALAHGTVFMDFVVGVKGRVTACRITRSSGNRALDEATCAMTLRYLRYRPGRDASGRPEPQTIEGEQHWTIDKSDRDDDGDR